VHIYALNISVCVHIYKSHSTIQDKKVGSLSTRGNISRVGSFFDDQDPSPRPSRSSGFYNRDEEGESYLKLCTPAPLLLNIFVWEMWNSARKFYMDMFVHVWYLCVNYTHISVIPKYLSSYLRIAWGSSVVWSLGLCGSDEYTSDFIRLWKWWWRRRYTVSDQSLCVHCILYINIFVSERH
jgi:hypothetical protein